MTRALRLLPLAVAVGLRDALMWGALAGGFVLLGTAIARGFVLLGAAIARQAGGMQ
jgi:hypothetical protein